MFRKKFRSFSLLQSPETTGPAGFQANIDITPRARTQTQCFPHYLSQRFSMPNRMAAAVLNDIGTEELAHLEMVSTIVHQRTRDLSMEEIEKSGLGAYYIDHTVGIWPQAAGGIPFNACEFQSKGDPLTDLFEDLAADGTTA